MKYTLRVPTEMYAFWECEFEGTIHDAWNHYQEKTMITKPQPVNQMPRKEYNEIYDLVVEGKPIADDPGILEKMSPEQRVALNEAKKSYKRRNQN